MTKIKICGLRRPEDISFVNECLPDFIGFVLAKSRRQVDEDAAYRLKQLLSPQISSVGVFVNAPLEEVVRLYRRGVIDIAQLHGDESAQYLTDLRAQAPSLPIIRAVRVRSTEQILETERLACDYLLLDTWQKDVYGGSGHSFDRSLIPPLTKPWFLAGGLTAENIREQIRLWQPYAVDVSSAVETDGCKDRAKILEFVRQARSQAQ